MGQIKSALELALERTADISANPEKVKEKQSFEEGQRIAGRLLNKEDINLDEAFEKTPKLEKFKEGFLQVLLSRLQLPKDQQQLEDMTLVFEILARNAEDKLEIEEMQQQVLGFLARYIDDKKNLRKRLEESFEPKLRQKEQMMMQQSGGQVKLTFDQDHEFIKLFKENIDHLDAQYQQVLMRVKKDMTENFG